jgi:hypothetical protein
VKSHNVAKLNVYRAAGFKRVGVTPEQRLHPAKPQKKRKVRDNYNPEEVRDPHGQWTSGGASGGPQTASPAFKHWFGASKIVDHEGKPMVLYHGTTQNFTEFSAKRGNNESNFANGFYFSNNHSDINENYAGMGPDLTKKIEREVEHIQGQEEDTTREAATARATAKHVAHGGVVIPVYLKMEHPFEIGCRHETRLDFDSGYNHETEEEEKPPSGKVVDFKLGFSRSTNVPDVAARHYIR